MIRRIVSSISAGILGPQESQNNAPHFPLLFPYFAVGMPGRFCKLSEGEHHGIRRSLSQLSGKPGHHGVSAGGRGNVGLLFDLF